jgi:hypothetical protein
MNPKTAKKQLYLQLSKDAAGTSAREKKYALMAKSEQKYADKDAKIGKKKHQIARVEDDFNESRICQDFFTYRMQISHFYENLAKLYKKKSEE